MKSELLVKNKIASDQIIKVAPFKKEIRKTTPHKHNSYFEIIFLSKGKGDHFIDSRQYAIKPPVIFFVRKEQVHHWNIKSEPTGFVLIIKKSFVEKSLDVQLKSLLGQLSKQSCLHLKEIGQLNQLFELLVNEVQAENPNSIHVIDGLLKALLSKIIDLSNPIQKEKKQRSNLYQAFLDLLNGDDPVKNNVAFYADKLNTSPQNLNAACRKAINLAASDILSEHIVSEAKRLLIYTDKTVSEISFDLGFADPSHFVKYFKRSNGQTPNVFRTTI